MRICLNNRRTYVLWYFLCEQVQGLTEHFQDTCGGIIGWLSSVTSYTAFTEGWALYAENPLIAYNTDVYKGQPLYKYGMLKSQVRTSLSSREFLFDARVWCHGVPVDKTQNENFPFWEGTWFGYKSVWVRVGCSGKERRKLNVANYITLCFVSQCNALILHNISISSWQSSVQCNNHV